MEDDPFPRYTIQLKHPTFSPSQAHKLTGKADLIRSAGFIVFVPIEHRSHHPLFPVLKTTPRMSAEKGRDTYMPTKQDPSGHLTSAKSRYLDLTSKFTAYVYYVSDEWQEGKKGPWIEKAINDFQNTATSTPEENASRRSQGNHGGRAKNPGTKRNSGYRYHASECYAADA